MKANFIHSLWSLKTSDYEVKLSPQHLWHNVGHVMNLFDYALSFLAYVCIYACKLK